MKHNDARRIRHSVLVTALAALLTAAGFVQPPASAQEDTAAERYFTPGELEELVGPIALYPDDLIAIILPASTYPLDIVQAARFLEEHEQDSSLEPDPEWDDSVVALLNYPDVLHRMNEDLDWTWDLGEAFLNQQVDVFAAVQDFREQARDAGNLASNGKQVVREEDGAIEIEPADEKVIYVPYYEPHRVVVYRHEPIYYYPRPYPVYYYPYPAGYSFHAGFFWGVTSAFVIGWNSHFLHVHPHVHFAHPYYHYRYRYYDPFYVRTSININIVDVDRSGFVWHPNYRRVAVTRYSGGAYDVQRRRYDTRSFEGRTNRSRAQGRASDGGRAGTTRSYSRTPGASGDTARMTARSGAARSRSDAQRAAQRQPQVRQPSAAPSRQRLTAAPRTQNPRTDATIRQRSRDDANRTSGSGRTPSRIAGSSRSPSVGAPSVRAAPSVRDRGSVRAQAPARSAPTVRRAPSVRSGAASARSGSSYTARSLPSTRARSTPPARSPSVRTSPGGRATSPAPSSGRAMGRAAPSSQTRASRAPAGRSSSSRAGAARATIGGGQRR